MAMLYSPSSTEEADVSLSGLIRERSTWTAAVDDIGEEDKWLVGKDNYHRLHLHKAKKHVRSIYLRVRERNQTYRTTYP
jgi:hypothetical protein